jgi:hypothetical protein
MILAAVGVFACKAVVIGVCCAILWCAVRDGAPPDGTT